MLLGLGGVGHAGSLFSDRDWSISLSSCRLDNGTGHVELEPTICDPEED